MSYTQRYIMVRIVVLTKSSCSQRYRLLLVRNIPGSWVLREISPCCVTGLWHYQFPVCYPGILYD